MITPTDPTAISDLVRQISTSAKPLIDTGNFASEEDRRNLIFAAEKLVAAAKSPGENIFSIATQAALRCAIGLGAFDIIPANGASITSSELSTLAGADRELVVRIMRGCTSTGIFHELGEETYSHNALSSTLIDPSNRALITLMYDFNGRSVIALPEFLAKNEWKKPGTYEDGSFQLAARTSLGFWEYLDEDEKRRKVFDMGMRAGIVGQLLGEGKLSDPFPFGEELGKDPLKEDQVLLVDIGGGRGQALEAIRVDYPQLKGRFVLQDLEPVIADAVAGGLQRDIEPMVGSFFEPQKIKGARAYHIRRVLHDWGDEKSREILVNTAAGMAEDSRLLITDMVVPNTNAPRQLAWEDLNMMTIGGVERTERQWQRLLESAGLKITKIWRNGDAEHAVIDAKLA
ncbi:S-adenosyl-L-methionine-dependent methyltransferase [Wilcoxina mikolae CBS 423.85]|nr:S-adenosyl-L-methionine-dependent methyltransferase [Wilcoxina mikolae CBS 423.85]